MTCDTVVFPTSWSETSSENAGVEIEFWSANARSEISNEGANFAMLSACEEIAIRSVVETATSTWSTAWVEGLKIVVFLGANHLSEKTLLQTLLFFQQAYQGDCPEKFLLRQKLGSWERC